MGHRVAPDAPVDVVALKHPAGVVRQDLEELELAARQVEALAGDVDLEAVRPDLEVARPLQALRQDADEPGVVVEHGYAEWSLRAHGLRGMVVARGAATATVHTTFTSNPATSGVVGFPGYMPINPTIAAGRPGEVL